MLVVGITRADWAIQGLLAKIPWTSATGGKDWRSLMNQPSEMAFAKKLAYLPSKGIRNPLSRAAKSDEQDFSHEMTGIILLP